MRLKFVILLLSCFIPVLAFSVFSLYAEESSNREVLLDGLLARESMIRTGTFVFKYGSMVINDKYHDRGQPWNWPEGEIPYTAELTVAGDEWVLRWPTTPIVSMHRGNFSTTYTETPQPDGQETYRSLVLTDAAGIHTSLEEECKSDMLFCVTKAGAVPTFLLSEFMRKNRTRIQYAGEKSIDGVLTHALQLRISKKEFSQIMSSLHPSYLKQDAMLITFYVAPLMAYAAVRIEYATPDGFVTKQYSASDFTEVAKGVFFPMCYCSINNFTDSKQGYYINQYVISELRNVNERVSESAFKVAIPAGARVRDLRPGSGDTVFFVDKDVTFSTADELIRKTIVPPRNNEVRIVFCLVGVLLMLFGIGLKLKEWYSKRNKIDPQPIQPEE